MLKRVYPKNNLSTSLSSAAVRSGGISLSVVVLLVLGLLFMGRPALCECGEVRLWTGDIFSKQMSQQISDWYSLTHVEHGLLFYFLGWLFLPRLSVNQRFLLAMTTEAAWEILENAPWFVQFYRQQALALGYTGDSILNSLSDVGFMALGYFIAATAPVWASVFLIVTIESLLALSIRDALLLNIVNFVHPFEFIARWQSGAR